MIDKKTKYSSSIRLMFISSTQPYFANVIMMKIKIRCRKSIKDKTHCVLVGNLHVNIYFILIILRMHYCLRTLIVYTILVSFILINVTRAGSILSAIKRQSVDTQKCRRPGDECDPNPPCCSGRCKVNWGGAWCV